MRPSAPGGADIKMGRGLRVGGPHPLLLAVSPPGLGEDSDVNSFSWKKEGLPEVQLRPLPHLSMQCHFSLLFAMMNDG
jgi:hypothetical protein